MRTEVCCWTDILTCHALGTLEPYPNGKVTDPPDKGSRPGADVHPASGFHRPRRLPAELRDTPSSAERFSAASRIQDRPSTIQR